MTPFIWCAVVGCGILALSLILDGLTDGLNDIFFDGSLPVIAAALGVFGAVGAGVQALTGEHVATAVLIGALLLVLIAVTLTLMRRAGTSVARGRTSRLLYGTLSGFTTMTANAGGPVMTMYLLASRFAVAPFLGTTAWFFFAVNVVKLPLSIGLGVIRVETLRLNAVLAPVVIVSALAGRRLAIRMNQNLFDRLVTALTVVSAGYLIIGAM